MLYHCGRKGEATPLGSEGDLLALKARAVSLLIAEGTQLAFLALLLSLTTSAL